MYRLTWPRVVHVSGRVKKNSPVDNSDGATSDRSCSACYVPLYYMYFGSHVRAKSKLSNLWTNFFIDAIGVGNDSLTYRFKRKLHYFDLLWICVSLYNKSTTSASTCWRCVLYNKSTAQATLIDTWPCQWPVVGPKPNNTPILQDCGFYGQRRRPCWICMLNYLNAVQSENSECG